MTEKSVAQSSRKEWGDYWKDGSTYGLALWVIITVIQGILGLVSQPTFGPQFTFRDYFLLMLGSLIASVAAGVLLESSYMYIEIPIVRRALVFCSLILLLEILIVTVWMFP